MHNETDRDEDAVVLVVVCNNCDAEFSWKPGFEEPDDRCPRCREELKD
jgi:hypothetical protein